MQNITQTHSLALVFSTGDKVRKIGGDYQFEGWIVAKFQKRVSLAVRFVVEDDRGVLHIYSQKNLEKIS